MSTRTHRPAHGAARALCIAAVGLGIVFWQRGEAAGGGVLSPPRPASQARGRLVPPPLPGPLGPEGVPIPAAPALAGPGRTAPGTRVDGIPCGTIEQLVFHVHAHLTLFVSGAQRRVPAGVGIGPPREGRSGGDRDALRAEETDLGRGGGTRRPRAWEAGSGGDRSTRLPRLSRRAGRRRCRGLRPRTSARAAPCAGRCVRVLHGLILPVSSSNPEASSSNRGLTRAARV